MQPTLPRLHAGSFPGFGHGARVSRPPVAPPKHVHVHLGDKEVADIVIDGIEQGGKVWTKTSRLVRQMVER